MTNGLLGPLVPCSYTTGVQYFHRNKRRSAVFQRPHVRIKYRTKAVQEVYVNQTSRIKDYGMDESGGNRLQTIVADVGLDTITVRCLDWDRDRFDIEFGLQNGTTYNSYLIFGKDATALVDASHEKFRELYMPVLKAELEARERTIDYLFVSHTEPDHSGLVKDVVEEYPDVMVLGSKVCIAFLENLTHVPMKTKVVKGGDTIDLGGGHVMEFVMAPNLHWPDTMFTYDHQSQIMFTCDAFGLHYCSEVGAHCRHFTVKGQNCLLLLIRPRGFPICRIHMILTWPHLKTIIDSTMIA